MSEKRKLKKKAQEPQVPVETEIKPTKIEYAVADYMRNNVPTKKTKFLSHQVNYFYANKAIDTLLDSPWASGNDILFTDRQSVVGFCDQLLRHKFFHRARKIAVTDRDLKPKELKKKKEKEKEGKKKEQDTKKKKEVKKEVEKKDDEDRKDEEPQKDDKSQDDTEKQEDKDGKEKKKKKTKIKLDMHLEQVFVDGTDAYVWMYDPIPFWYYIVGALCLFGAIAICLFPLWPPTVRKGVYYLSICAAGFLGVILGLAVIRFIVFIIIWSLSMGRHHFWLLPNLTEDVGFFQSFWPLYKYEYRGSDYKKKPKKKKKEEEDEEAEEEEDEAHQQKELDKISEVESTDADRGDEEAARSETDTENSNSQTFEMVEKDELSNGQKEK